MTGMVSAPLAWWAGRDRPTPQPRSRGDDDPRVTDAAPRMVGGLPAVWNVERRNRSFTGREEVLMLLHARLCADGAAVVQALHGMGGVGKTQLVVEYAHRYASSYDLVWWVDAERAGRIGAQLAGLAVEAGWVGREVDIPVAVGEVAKRLRSQAGWLVVFDNAEGPESVRTWLPQGRGHVLITSRNSGWGLLAVPVPVDVFGRHESVELLRRQVPTLSEVDAGRLAQELGDLPLAVVQAAGVLAETGMSVDEYQQELAERAAKVMSDGVPASYPVSLAAAVRVSVGRLGVEDAAAVQLLRLCAFLASEPVPIVLFAGAPRGILPEPLAAVACSPLPLRRVLGRIGRYGLARISAEGPLVHRLTQAVVRDLLNPSNRQVMRRRAEALLVAAGPLNGNDPTCWPLWEALMPHLLTAGPATSTNPDLRRLAVRASWYVLCRGDIRAGLEFSDELHAAWRDRLGPDDPDTLWARHSMAWAYSDLGRYAEAQHVHQDALARMRRVLGEDHLETLACADALACDLYHLGQYEPARQLYQDTLARARRVLGEDHPHTLATASNLADVLREMGEVESARQVHEDTLTRKRRVLGEDHPQTLNSATQFAIDLYVSGQYDLARDVHEDTLTRYRLVLGENHPETLRCADTLAVDLRALGQHEQARQLQKDTLARMQRVLGKDHPYTLLAVQNLAIDLRRQHIRMAALIALGFVILVGAGLLSLARGAR